MKWSLRSWSSWVATPVAQLFRWQMRRYLQPRATIGAVPKPKLSAPRMAALMTSRPVFRPPSTCTTDLAAQAVGHQGLLRLGQAQLPRAAGVLDRGQAALAPVPPS